MRLRRETNRLATTIVGLVMLASVPTPARADCTPGEDGCMPTPEQCASGDYNGAWDGGEPGRVAVCVGADGTTLVYAGGTVIPSPCGHIMVANQTVPPSGGDPNDCFPPGRTVERVRLPMDDGVELDAAIWRPDVAEGVEVPVVIHATPYPGQAFIAPRGFAAGPLPAVDSPGWLEHASIDHLPAQGYAVVNLSVRGTGNSGGCFEFGGPNEQKDMATVVELLADAPWSNGKVAMVGHSYSGMTPWFAAVQGVEALKTIVVSGIVTDLYTLLFTPQGAISAFDIFFGISYPVEVGAPFGALSVGTATDPSLAGYAPAFLERACPEVAHVATVTTRDTLRDERDAEFWDARRTIDHYEDITAAVFISQGFRDSGHGYQDTHVWDTLTQAPRRMLLGHWSHGVGFPEPQHLTGYPHGDDWATVVTEWLDHWLKGIGDEPLREGVVDHQRLDGSWTASAAWPPPEAQEEALYLDAGGLAAQPGTGASSFTVAPGTSAQGAVPDGTTPSTYCEPERSPGTALAFHTEAADEPAVFAGNPFTYVSLEASEPGGILSVDIYDVAPGASCSAAGEAAGVTWVTNGAADLRFHAGGFEGFDFPVGEPTNVRVDLFNVTWTLRPGHRLAVVVSGPGRHGRVGQPYRPTITLHANASHLVLPVVEGTFGGAPTGIAYPPRPFIP